MRQEIAEWVFPIFRRAIEIKEGLRIDDTAWEFSQCRQELLALLQKPVPEAVRVEVMGDQRLFDASMTSTRVGGFFGIRYALACWLDEIFIDDSPWKTEWNENKMETTLFEINVRANKFWEQSQRAQRMASQDAIEAYYLCVMLGFRGELAEKPRELAAWRDTVEAQLTKDHDYTPPPSLKVTPDVRILKGVQAMHKWFMILTAVGLLFIPLLVVLVSRM